MLRSIISLTVFILSCTLLNANAADNKPQSDTTTDNSIPIALDEQPECPLTVSNNDNMSLGNFPEYANNRTLSFTLTNKTDKEITVKRIRTTCPCLSMTQFTNKVMKPGDKIDVTAELDISKIPELDFKRAIFVETKGFRPLAVQISGIRTPIADISPATIIDLGVFEGIDVTWTRSFTITCSLPEYKGRFNLIFASKPSKVFNYKLTRLEQDKYRLDVTPKLPIHPSKIREMLTLKVKDGPEEAKVILGIMGSPIGRKFTPSKTRVYPKKSTLLAGENCEDTIELTIDDHKDSKKRFLNRPAGRKESSYRWKMKTIRLDASNEENVAKNKDFPAYVKSCIKDLSFKAPAGLTVTPVPQKDKITLKLLFTPDFAKNLQPKPLEIIYRGIPFSTIKLGLSRGITFVPNKTQVPPQTKTPPTK